MGTSINIRGILCSQLGGLLIGLGLLCIICSCSVVLRGGAPDDGQPGTESVHKFKNLGIPPGHLPPPGYCRIWIPGRPPGHQPPPGKCSELEHRIPVGAWLIYRDIYDPDHIDVYVYHDKRPSVVVVVRRFEAATGRFLSESEP